MLVNFVQGKYEVMDAMKGVNDMRAPAEKIQKKQFNLEAEHEVMNNVGHGYVAMNQDGYQEEPNLCSICQHFATCSYPDPYLVQIFPRPAHHRKCRPSLI